MPHRNPAREKFAEIKKRLSIPVVGSPLFIVSNPKLVIAQCKAGIIGSFPALNARPKEALDEWLTEIKSALAAHDAAKPEQPAAPFAVNQIVHRSNDRLMHDLDACVKHKVPIVITSLGAREEVNEAVHSYGGLVFHDVIDIKFAKKAIEKGADGLIPVAAGAGGHAGTMSPFAIMQEIREWFDGPVLLSGCIARGESVLAAEAMGADAGYIGSAFIATHEANAHEGYKNGIVDGNMEDIVYTNYFSGVHGNYHKGSIKAAGMDPDNLPVADPTKMNFNTEQETTAKAWKDIWGSGQGIGAVHEVQSAGDYVAELIAQYKAAREKLLG
ncbi:nitronate monooxygenase family protein [Parvularcula sp. IMCC14364]|uniref:NAD(P)H-dependent flavin oxidoreductase n=1 Tax=Parvularcula sp. IMCC14364 TaxID=3067902 RepID=UPI002742119F|nr:nitronate monooxygenase family protein [Parvularcula sp. IMCC14364]